MDSNQLHSEYESDVQPHELLQHKKLQVFESENLPKKLEIFLIVNSSESRISKTSTASEPSLPRCQNPLGRLYFAVSASLTLNRIVQDSNLQP